MLDKALALATAGYRVFPVNARTKRPCIKQWQILATREADQLTAWWVDFPNAAPAILCGDGLMVIDLDSKPGRDGLGWWRAMALLEDAAPTMTVRTPSGGYHLYYRTDVDVTTRADHPVKGVDTRGRGGFVVGPGAVRDGKIYEVVDYAEVLA